MENQRGQAIIILVLAVLGFILYANFSGSDIIGKWFEGYKIKPNSQAPPSSTIKETKISAPAVSVPPSSTVPAPITPTPDTVPPKRFNVQPKDKSQLSPETRQIILGLETNEKATCKYSNIAGFSYNSMQHFFDQTDATLHSVPITTLSEGEKYKYYIKCSDTSGNKNTDDFTVSFEVKLPEDKMPPALMNPSHQGYILPKDTKEAVISVSTDEPAFCRYSASAETQYSSMSGSFSYYDQTKKFHVKTITGLQNGKSYDFFVRCKDLAGNSNAGDVLISFSVGI